MTVKCHGKNQNTENCGKKKGETIYPLTIPFPMTHGAKENFSTNPPRTRHPAKRIKTKSPLDELVNLHKTRITLKAPKDQTNLLRRPNVPRQKKKKEEKWTTMSLIVRPNLPFPLLMLLLKQHIIF